MKLIKCDHHRNGITGIPFFIGIVKDDLNKNKLIIQFDGDLNYTSVLDLDLLKKDIIEFGKNSFKSEIYADDFNRLANEDFKEKYGVCLE